MSNENWIEICHENDVTPGTGVCALVSGQQVAIFKERKLGKIFAISNYDPIGKANVLSRGLVGDLKGEIVVASPLYKQHFSLTTGKCLEQPELEISTYPVRVEQGKIQLNYT